MEYKLKSHLKWTQASVYKKESIRQILEVQEIASLISLSEYFVKYKGVLVKGHG